MSVKLSTRVAKEVLKARGLEGKATIADLKKAAAPLDVDGPGYLARDELERGAAALEAALGGAPSAERKRMDAAKEALLGKGVRVVDADLQRALKHVVDKAAPNAIDVAAWAIGEAHRLAALDAGKLALPARPTAQAHATDFDAALNRRKLSSTFSYQGGPVKVAFFDADDTLRTAPSKKVSANGPKDAALLPGVADELKRLAAAGYLIAIASNQNGVEQGYVTLADADEALAYTADMIRALGGDVHWIDCADKRDGDRKPGTGMRDRLQRTLIETYGPQAVIDPAATQMVGDGAYKQGVPRPDGRQGVDFSDSDRMFADAMGVKFVEPDVQFGWADVGLHRMGGIDGRAAFVDRFAVGKTSSSSPLLAYLGGR
jgi:DNA 3'-phosphatase